MRSVICLLSVLCMVSVSFANTSSLAVPFEWVESVPVDTSYGEPGVRSTLTVWLDMIAHARHSICIGSFYINDKNDEDFHKVIQALVHAAARGVRVRMVIDKSFKWQSKASVAKLVAVKGIFVRYMPMGDLTGGVMHAKYFVVDEGSLYVGSANFDWKAIDQVHELGVRITNARLAQTVMRVFEMDWSLAARSDVPWQHHLIYMADQSAVTAMRPVLLSQQSKSMLIHPAFSPKRLMPADLDTEQSQLIAMLNAAHDHISIQVLTYSPRMAYGVKGYWSALADALRAAAARGVKVKMIVSDWAMRYPGKLYLEALNCSPNIKVKYSVVPELKYTIHFARVEHLKYVLVDDDLVWLGTGNWQWSYFYASRDISLIIQSRSQAKIIRHIFDRDWRGGYVHNII